MFRDELDEVDVLRRALWIVAMREKDHRIIVTDHELRSVSQLANIDICVEIQRDTREQRTLIIARQPDEPGYEPTPRESRAKRRFRF